MRIWDKKRNLFYMNVFRPCVFKAISLNWWGRSNIVIFRGKKKSLKTTKKNVFFLSGIVPWNLQPWLVYFKGELEGEISSPGSVSFLEEPTFTFRWITQIHSSYWKAKDIFTLNLGNHMLIMSHFVSWLVEKNVEMPYSVLFSPHLTVLIHCRRQSKNNSMRLTDNCRCIYTDILILECCLEIQLEVMLYASK